MGQLNGEIPIVSTLSFLSIKCTDLGTHTGVKGTVNELQELELTALNSKPHQIKKKIDINIWDSSLRASRSYLKDW